MIVGRRVGARKNGSSGFQVSGSAGAKSSFPHEKEMVLIRQPFDASLCKPVISDGAR